MLVSFTCTGAKTDSTELVDTIVFFKKGKFYELYEDDATIGHQLFDMKLTDRVNMRMVGVPEMSLNKWVSQFVGQGHKIARVDQAESALGKQMREREEPPAKGGKGKKVDKADKIIRRELSCIMTRGTLVEGSMLADDMATYVFHPLPVLHSNMNQLLCCYQARRSRRSACVWYQLCRHSHWSILLDRVRRRR